MEFFETLKNFIFYLILYVREHDCNGADHTTNITEDLINLIEGDIVRHSKLKE